MSTRVMEHLKVRGFIAKFIFGIKSLLTGLRITFYYLSHPSTVVTQQYPENRKTLKLADRTRAQLSFIHDENGLHKCTACHICEQNCPNASIHVVERKGPITGKDEIDYFIWRLDTCTFCNLCVMTCPFGVLKMDPTFESSVYDQRLMVYNLNKCASPSATMLYKITDLEERKKYIEPRDIYSGPMPMTGEYMAGIDRNLSDDQRNKL